MDTVNILIVDDSYDKIKRIISMFDENDKIKFHHTTNSKDAVNLMRQIVISVLILDLQIPEALGEDICIDGGEKLLCYLEENGSLKNKPVYIIGLTSHQESMSKCKDIFQQKGWLLLFDDGIDTRIKEIIEAQVKYMNGTITSCDIAIIVALDSVELAAVLALPYNWIPFTINGDCNRYYRGEVIAATRTLNILATSCLYPGIAHASSITMKVIMKFSPTYIFMTGIAAGIKGKVNIGDVVVSDPCWNWESGKRTSSEGQSTFLISPKQYSLPVAINSKLKYITSIQKYASEIYAAWEKPNRPNTKLRIHLGPLATGSSVLQDPAVVNSIKLQNRDVLAIEMEAYGVSVAASLSSSTPPNVIVIKSICDFADPKKNDTWQDYASYTSARFCHYFITEELFPKESSL